MGGAFITVLPVGKFETYRSRGLLPVIVSKFFLFFSFVYKIAKIELKCKTLKRFEKKSFY